MTNQTPLYIANQNFQIGQDFNAGGNLYQVWNVSIECRTVHAAKVGTKKQLLSSKNPHNHLVLTFDRVAELVEMGAIT